MISARRVVWVSFLVDFSDILLSFLVTLLSGSVVMLSQVLQGLVDLSASGFLVLGIRLARKPADQTHPFGHGREVYFWSLLSSLLMMGITATLSLYFGWQRFLRPEPVDYLPFAFLSLLITLITNGYAFSLSVKRLLRNYPARAIVPIFFRSSLVETKTTFILDLMGTLASFLGLLSLGIYQYGGDQRFDGLGAMGIGLMLIIFSFFLLIGVKDLLVGRSASPEVEEKIKVVAKAVVGVVSVAGVKTMYIGPESLLVNVDVVLERDLRTAQIEEIVSVLHREIKTKVERAAEVQVEIAA